MDGNIVLPNPPPRPVSQDGKPQYFAWPNRQGGQEAKYSSVPSQTMAGFPPSAESEGIPTSEHSTMWHLDPAKEERNDEDLNEYSEDQRSDMQGSPAGMRYPPPSSDQMLSAINCSTDDLHDTEGSLIEDAASISNGNRLEDGILGDGISMGTAQNYSLFEDHGGVVVDPEAPPYISEAQLSPHNMEEHSPFVSMATMGGADMGMKKEPPERPRSATPQARKGPRPIARGRSSSLDSQLSTGSTASSGSDSKSSKKRAGRPARGSPSRHPVDCPQCGKTFSSSSSLAKHRSTHSEERKYVCQICGKAFKRQDHLNGHINTHRERKPFPCMVPGCDKSYCDTRSLRRHFELHHSELGPFYLPSPPSPQQAMTAMTRGVPPAASSMPPPSSSRDPQPSYSQAGEVASPSTEISIPRPPEEAAVTSSQAQQRSHGEAMQSLAQFARRAQQQQPQPQPPVYQERPPQPGAPYSSWALQDQPTSGTQPRYTVNLDSFFASQLVAAANGGSTQMVLPQQVFSQAPPAYMPPTSQATSHTQMAQAQITQAANQAHRVQGVSQAQVVQGANQVQMIQAANQAQMARGANQTHAVQSGMQIQMSQATDQAQMQMGQAANQRQMAQAVSQAQMAQATAEVQLGQVANQAHISQVEHRITPSVSQAQMAHIANQMQVSQTAGQPQIKQELGVQATSQLQYNQAANNAQVAQRLAQAQAKALDDKRQVPAPPPAGFSATQGGPWQQSFPYELQALLTSNHSQWSRQAPVPGSKTTLPAQTTAAPQKPVECQTCGRQFRSLPALNGHMRLHGGYEKNKKKDASSESLAALTQTVAAIGNEERGTPEQLPESAHPVLQSLVMGTATVASLAASHPSSTTNPALLHHGAGGNESGAVLSDYLYPSKESKPTVKTEIRLPETTTHLPGSYSALKRQHQVGSQRGGSSQSDSDGPPELERMDFPNYEASIVRQQPQLSPVTSSTDSTKEIANVVASLLAQDYSNQGSYTTVGPSALQQQSHSSSSVSFSLPFTSAGLAVPAGAATSYSSEASTIIYSAQPVVRSQASSTGEVWRTPVISVSPVLPKKAKSEADTMSPQAPESSAPPVPRKRKPPALNIPDSVNAHVAVGPIVYQSHMRSPRALNGDFIFTQAQGAEPPYTPPPMLSPIRVGSGLYFSTFCKNENEKLLTPVPRQPSTPFLSPSPNLLFSRQWSWQDAGVRPKVNVGPNFQADSRQIPECNKNKADALKEEEKAELVFHPECVEKLTDKEVRAYLETACSKVTPLGGRNKEYAFHLLYRCNGDIMTAVPKLMTKPALLPKDSFMQTYHYSGSTRWNKKDKANFEEAIKQYGKSFSDFKEFLPNKTVDQCVEFYYRWKHTTGKKDKVILGRTRLQARRAEEAQWGRSISFDSEVETPRTILPQFVSPDSSFVKPSSPTPEPSHVFCCTIEGCNATFPTRQGLNGHTRVHGGTGNNNQTAKRNSKPDNGKKKRKRRRSNSLSPPPSNASATSHESGESSMTGATTVEGEGDFPCRICGKVFHKVKSRSAHMKTHRKVDREEEKTEKILVSEASKVSVLPMSNHMNTSEEDLQDAFE